MNFALIKLIPILEKIHVLKIGNEVLISDIRFTGRALMPLQRPHC